MRQAFRVRWPEFIFHDPVSNAHVERIGQYFGAWDLWLIEGDHVVAGGWGVPLRWNGTVADLPDGYDGALVRSVEGHEAGDEPDTLCIMAAAVAADAGRKGLAPQSAAAIIRSGARRLGYRQRDDARRRFGPSSCRASPVHGQRNSGSDPVRELTGLRGPWRAKPCQVSSLLAVSASAST